MMVAGCLTTGDLYVDRKNKKHCVEQYINVYFVCHKCKHLQRYIATFRNNKDGCFWGLRNTTYWWSQSYQLSRSTSSVGVPFWLPYSGQADSHPSVKRQVTIQATIQQEHWNTWNPVLTWIKIQFSTESSPLWWRWSVCEVLKSDNLVVLINLTLSMWIMVDVNSFYHTCWKHGINEKCWRLIKSRCANPESEVKHNGYLSHPFI